MTPQVERIPCARFQVEGLPGQQYLQEVNGHKGKVHTVSLSLLQGRLERDPDGIKSDIGCENCEPKKVNPPIEDYLTILDSNRGVVGAACIGCLVLNRPPDPTGRVVPFCTKQQEINIGLFSLPETPQR